MIAALRVSLGLFTILPVRVPADPSRTTVRGAILAAPLVGLFLGLLASGVLAIGRVILDSHTEASPTGQAVGALLASTLALAVLTGLTGGLHLDGLADTADALASRRGATESLGIMRRSDIGPMGVVAIVFILLIDVGALALSVVNGHGTLALITGAVAGRSAAVWACRGSAARSDGLGAWVAGSVTWMSATAVTVAATCVPLALVLLEDDNLGIGVSFALAAVPVACLVGGLIAAGARRRWGGITGDVLGAVIEIATTAALLTIALTP